MYAIRYVKERVWVFEYPPGHKLKWAWTLHFDKATRYGSVEAATQRAKELGVDGFVIDKDRSAND